MLGARSLLKIGYVKRVRLDADDRSICQTSGLYCSLATPVGDKLGNV
jgi:hypothetical protein